MKSNVWTLHFHDFFFFFLAVCVNIFNKTVGQFLQIVLAALQLIFRDHLFFLKVAQIVLGVTTDISDSDARFFQTVVNHLYKLAPAFFVQRRQVEVDGLAIVVGCQAQV